MRRGFTADYIIFNAAVPFSREQSVLSVVQHRSLLRAVLTSTCCSGWEKTLSMVLVEQHRSHYPLKSWPFSLTRRADLDG